MFLSAHYSVALGKYCGELAWGDERKKKRNRQKGTDLHHPGEESLPLIAIAEAKDFFLKDIIISTPYRWSITSTYACANLSALKSSGNPEVATEGF